MHAVPAYRYTRILVPRSELTITLNLIKTREFQTMLEDGGEVLRDLFVVRLGGKIGRTPSSKSQPDHERSVRKPALRDFVTLYMRHSRKKAQAGRIRKQGKQLPWQLPSTALQPWRPPSGFVICMFPLKLLRLVGFELGRVMSVNHTRA
jgi:hypothetical protein